MQFDPCNDHKRPLKNTPGPAHSPVDEEEEELRPLFSKSLRESRVRSFQTPHQSPHDSGREYSRGQLAVQSSCTTHLGKTDINEVRPLILSVRSLTPAYSIRYSNKVEDAKPVKGLVYIEVDPAIIINVPRRIPRAEAIPE